MSEGRCVRTQWCWQGWAREKENSWQKVEFLPGLTKGKIGALCIGAGFGSRKVHEDLRPWVLSRTGSAERNYTGQEAPNDICIIPIHMHLYYTQCMQMKFFQISI